MYRDITQYFFDHPFSHCPVKLIGSNVDKPVVKSIGARARDEGVIAARDIAGRIVDPQCSIKIIAGRGITTAHSATGIATILPCQRCAGRDDDCNDWSGQTGAVSALYCDSAGYGAINWVGNSAARSGHGNCIAVYRGQRIPQALSITIP